MIFIIFRTTDQGTLEAIPETIQLLLDDDENVEQQIVSQNEGIDESMESQNDHFDQYQIQYGGDNSENSHQQQEESRETTHFDIIDQNNHYEEQQDFNEMQQINYEDTEEDGGHEQEVGSDPYCEENRESKTTFNVFVKREPEVQSEQFIPQEERHESDLVAEYEADEHSEEEHEEEEYQENTDSSIDIKPGNVLDIEKCKLINSTKALNEILFVTFLFSHVRVKSQCIFILFQH